MLISRVLKKLILTIFGKVLIAFTEEGLSEVLISLFLLKSICFLFHLSSPFLSSLGILCWSYSDFLRLISSLILNSSFLKYTFGGGLVAKSCLILWIPWTVPCRAPLCMGFPRQEYWSGLPFPPPGDLSNPGIKPVSSALAGGFFNTEPRGKPKKSHKCLINTPNSSHVQN